MYEILHANFGKGVFPSPRTVESWLSAYDLSVPEGQINVKMLKEILVQHNLPLCVCISEDATAITGRREYNRKTNSIFGSSGPLRANGLPDSSSFVVKTTEDIIHHFNHFPRAYVAMVVMAQPICDKFPAIRLCTFGSDNKFTTDDVKNRAITIEKELNKEGIEVLTYSADGDSRELKMMRKRIKLGMRLPKVPRGK